MAGKKANLRIEVRNLTGKPAAGKLRIAASGINLPQTPSVAAKEVQFTAPGQDTLVNVEYPLGESALLWDEFSPALYKLNVSMTAGPAESPWADEAETTFGLREFKPEGTQFALNGRLVFLRGTLECCVFPLTALSANRRGLVASRAHRRPGAWAQPPAVSFLVSAGGGLHRGRRDGVHVPDRMRGLDFGGRQAQNRRVHPCGDPADPSRLWQPSLLLPSVARQRARRQGQRVLERLGRSL